MGNNKPVFGKIINSKVGSRMRIMKNYATKFIGKCLTVCIDRAIGSKHPKFGHVYLVNYGYIANTEAPDGEPVDAYVLGPKKPVSEFEGRCIAVIQRTDDDDDKLIVTNDGSDYSDGEIKNLTNFQEKYFKSVIVRRNTIENLI